MIPGNFKLNLILKQKYLKLKKFCSDLNKKIDYNLIFLFIEKGSLFVIKWSLIIIFLCIVYEFFKFNLISTVYASGIDENITNIMKETKEEISSISNSLNKLQMKV